MSDFQKEDVAVTQDDILNVILLVLKSCNKTEGSVIIISPNDLQDEPFEISDNDLLKEIVVFLNTEIIQKHEGFRKLLELIMCKSIGSQIKITGGGNILLLFFSFCFTMAVVNGLASTQTSFGKQPSHKKQLSSPTVTTSSDITKVFETPEELITRIGNFRNVEETNIIKFREALENSELSQDVSEWLTEYEKQFSQLSVFIGNLSDGLQPNNPKLAKILNVVTNVVTKVVPVAKFLTKSSSMNITDQLSLLGEILGIDPKEMIIDKLKDKLKDKVKPFLKSKKWGVLDKITSIGNPYKLQMSILKTILGPAMDELKQNILSIQKTPDILPQEITNQINDLMNQITGGKSKKNPTRRMKKKRRTRRQTRRCIRK
jgi:hypothetical protein